MAADTAAWPMVLPPSGSWDGNDGPWSTFEVQVGTPPQPVRVLISTVLGQTFVVSANKSQGGCIGTDPPTCPQSRGGLFNLNASRTWQDQGIYGLGLEDNLQDYLDDGFSGDFGFDALGLGAAGSSGVRLDAQVLAAIATKDFYLGFLGVDAYPTNFSSFDNPDNTHVSFLSALKQSNNTPSLSYGYSAGAKYRSNQPFGSLTFGGYDTSKFVPSNVSFQMASDVSRDLVVNLDSIVFDDGSLKRKMLLPEKILTFIDSTVPHIWLPLDSCALFEDAFGITYDSTVERYLVNDTLHTQLQHQNANVSFVISNTASNETFKIDLPYASFDLEIGPPFVDTTQRYFPLRQAENDTQYTLGRTFLQESYLIANYEHGNFSISQRIWPEDSASSGTTPAQIVAIAPVISTNGEATSANASANRSTSTSASKSASASTSTSTTKPHAQTKFPRGTISSVAASAVFFGILVASICFYTARKRNRRRRKARTKTETDSESYHKAEMDGNGRILRELEALDIDVPEMDSDSSKMEMQGSDASSSALDRPRTELQGSNVSAELEGDILVAGDKCVRPVGMIELAAPSKTGRLQFESSVEQL